MRETTKDLKAFTARFPDVLYIAAQNDVARRKANGERKLSMQDWLQEAAREKLYPESGPGQRNPVQISAPQFPEKSGSENSAPLSIRTVGPGVRPDLPEGHHFRDANGDWVPPTEAVIPAELMHPKMQKLSAAELAAKFGVKTLATIEEVEPRLLADDPAFVSPIASDYITPVQEHMPSRNWQNFFAEMKEMDPGEAAYAWHAAVEGIKLPPRFRDRPEQKQIAWLNANA